MIKKINVAILGTGNIGTDLLFKIIKSPYLNCILFSGRSNLSPGIKKIKKTISQKKNKSKFKDLIVSSKSVQSLINESNKFDIIFDCTSAKFHKKNEKIFKNLNKKIINLTPTQNGYMCIPVLNLEECNKSIELNMVSCGAQSSVPVAYSLAKIFKKKIKYIETISTISSKSAGPATRLNLDEYIYTTQRAIRYFSGIKNAKAILNLNPAVPCINMQTTTYAQIEKSINKSELKRFKNILKLTIIRMTKYIKGHKIIVEPIVTDNVISVKTSTIGRGDYLPKYAGNLDIINCAAIAAGEHYAKEKQKNNN